MLHSMSELDGYTVNASDGEVGTVHDFYFDDNRWVVRYLAVEAGDWLEGRRLLFSPSAFQEIDPQQRRLSLSASREVVAGSPSIGIDRPLSREQELELHRHYQWPLYWDTRTDDAIGPGTTAAYPMIELMTEIEEKTSSPGDLEYHLRRAKEVSGYEIHARDGDSGRVKDFIFDDEAWRILYLIADTGGILPGKLVLLSPSWIEKVSWEESKISMDLEKATIQNSPEYDKNIPLDREFESRLYEYFGRKGNK